MDATEADGRFLPSRVYKRWTWTVRCGLMLIPSLVFLSGGIVLFFTPNVYRSTAMAEFRNGPPAGEIVELLQSGGVLERATSEVSLRQKMEVDSTTAVKILKENLSIETIPETGFIRVSVALTDKEMARDIVAAIPRNLIVHLVKADKIRTEKAVSRMNSIIIEATDTAEEKQKDLANRLSIHGTDPSDAGEAALLERTRKLAGLADARVEELQANLLEFVTGGIVKVPELVIHTAPEISEMADSPSRGSELGWLSMRSLLYGLATALLMPYLLELVFPPQRENLILADPVGYL